MVNNLSSCFIHVGQNSSGIPLRTPKLLYACLCFLPRFVLDLIENMVKFIVYLVIAKTKTTKTKKWIIRPGDADPKTNNPSW